MGDRPARVARVRDDRGATDLASRHAFSLAVRHAGIHAATGRPAACVEHTPVAGPRRNVAADAPAAGRSGRPRQRGAVGELERPAVRGRTRKPGDFTPQLEQFTDWWCRLHRGQLGSRVQRTPGHTGGDRGDPPGQCESPPHERRGERQRAAHDRCRPSVRRQQQRDRQTGKIECSGAAHASSMTSALVQRPSPDRGFPCRRRRTRDFSSRESNPNRGTLVAEI